MKIIGKCEICGGKIIQIGNGNIFCNRCADKNYAVRLQDRADIKEKRRIKRHELENIS